MNHRDLAVSSRALATAPREYWSVQTRGSGCRVSPRPDGDERIVAECGKGTPLARELEDAQLCKFAESSSDVKAATNLRCETAAHVAAFLNKGFQFQVRVGPTAASASRAAGVTTTTYPAVRGVDVLIACAKLGDASNTVLANACAFEESRCVDGVCRADARAFTPAETRALAATLNAFYVEGAKAH